MTATDFEPKPGAAGDRRVGRGVAILGLSVAAFVVLLLDAFIAFSATQFDDRIVDGRQTVEFTEGRWKVLAPYREWDAEAVVTDSDGRDVPVDHDHIHPAESGALVIEDDREWMPNGRLEIPADGTYTIDTGDVAAHFRKVNYIGFFISLGLVAAAFVAGFTLLIAGLAVMTSPPRPNR